MPPTGAYIIAPTHRSNLDTPFTAFVTKRRIRFMAKQEMFQHPLGAKFFTALGGVPVERGSPNARAALKATRAALETGEPVAMFPEGTRRHGREVSDLFDGTAYLAVKLGVPIVPVGIGGSEEILASGKKIPKFRRVAVVIGEPIEPPTRRDDPQAQRPRRRSPRSSRSSCRSSSTKRCSSPATEPARSTHRPPLVST